MRDLHKGLLAESEQVEIGERESPIASVDSSEDDDPLPRSQGAAKRPFLHLINLPERYFMDAGLMLFLILLAVALTEGTLWAILIELRRHHRVVEARPAEGRDRTNPAA
jgi:hypothetical protein